MHKVNLLPTSTTAKRVAAIMHRQLTTSWTKKEVATFKTLLPIPEQDLAEMERYYSRNWPPRSGHNILRHDLATLLNNWPSELDRARIWCGKHPVKVRKIIAFTAPAKPDLEQDWTEEEREKNQLQRAALKQLKARLRG